MTDRARWFSDCEWGVFCHWLGAAPSSAGGAELSAEAWNDRVDAFDVEGFSRQLEAIGVPYFLITIGQNSGHYIQTTGGVPAEVGGCHTRVVEPLGIKGPRLVD